MKAFMRVLLKLILFCLVVALAAGGAVGFRTYQRSAPDYIIDRYLSLLLEDDSEKAFELLDQSEEDPMTAEKFAEALAWSDVAGVGPGLGTGRLQAVWSVRGLYGRRGDEAHGRQWK